MDLVQLRTLRTVAETLNFTRAAERLGLTQSGVSQQIKTLEAELGEPLFVRVKRGVILSDAGKLAHQYAVRILDESDALKERLSGPGQPLSGRVRVAAATQAFVYLFAGLFESFMKAHPSLELSFRTTASTEQTLADILGGGADIGFAGLPVYSPTLQVVEVFRDELFLVVGRRHRLASRAAAAPSDLEAERFILFERGNSIRRSTDQFFHQLPLVPALALETNDTYFVKVMVERGLGVSLLPAWATREEVQAGRLVRLPVRGHRLQRTVSMISLGRFPASSTRAFVAHVLAHREALQAIARGESAGQAPGFSSADEP
jgi:DNA-binding transcriptional LysR family regulator